MSALQCASSARNSIIPWCQKHLEWKHKYFLKVKTLFNLPKNIISTKTNRFESNSIWTKCLYFILVNNLFSFGYIWALHKTTNFFTLFIEYSNQPECIESWKSICYVFSCSHSRKEIITLYTRIRTFFSWNIILREDDTTWLTTFPSFIQRIVQTILHIFCELTSIFIIFVY